MKWSYALPLSIPADSGRVNFSLDSVEVFKNSDPSDVVFSARLMKENTLLSENLLYFVPAKKLKLTPPLLSFSIGSAEGQTILQLESKTLAKTVFIDFGDSKVELSDNYLDLLPGLKKSMVIKSNLSSDELTKLIKVKSLVDTY